MTVFNGTKEILYGGLPYTFMGRVFWDGDHDYEGSFTELDELGNEIDSTIEPSADELAEALNLNQNEYAYDELDGIYDLMDR